MVGNDGGVSMNIKLSNNRLIVNGTITFDLQLKSNIVIVKGNSSTCKSLLYNDIKKCLEAERSLPGGRIVADKSIGLINFTDEYKGFNENTLYLIDNADIVMTDTMSADILNNHYNNKYIIFGRQSYGLHLSPKQIGEFYVGDDNVVRIRYRG